MTSGCWWNSSLCHCEVEVPQCLAGCWLFLVPWCVESSWRLSLALNSSYALNLPNFSCCNPTNQSNHKTPQKNLKQGLMHLGPACLDNFPPLRLAVPYSLPSYRSQISHSQAQGLYRACITVGGKSWGPSWNAASHVAIFRREQK